MASQANNGNYTKAGSAGQKRRVPPPPPIQAPPGKRQIPVGRGGGPRQLPQYYQQTAAPELGPVSNIEQSNYTHHSQPYQASYDEGIPDAEDARNAWDDYDDHDRHNMPDVGPLSAALNDINAPAGNYDPSAVSKYICEVSKCLRELSNHRREQLQYQREQLQYQRQQLQYQCELLNLKKAKAEAGEKDRSDAKSVESIKVMLEGLKLHFGASDQLSRKGQDPGL